MIHASRNAGMMRVYRTVAEWLDDGCEIVAATPQDVPMGAILGVVDLVDCVPLEKIPRRDRYRRYASGPWCWILENPQRFEVPIPCSGQQKLWEFPEARLSAVLLKL